MGRPRTRAHETSSAFDSWRTLGASDLMPERAAPGTFDWMVAEFRSDRRYREKDPKTRRQYDQGLELAGAYVLKDGRRFGSLRLEQITPKAADRLYEALRLPRAPQASTN